MDAVRIVALLALIGCGRVNFGYPVVACEDVVSLDSLVGSGDQCFTRHEGPIHQPGARDACHALGGHLATVTSQEEQDDLVRLGFRGPTRIGLSTFQNVIFLWETGEPLVFTAWAPGYPMTYNNGESNGMIDASGTWTTDVHIAAHDFACEIEPWLVVDGHGYRVHWRAGTWLEGKIACEDMGGHLATIDSTPELEAITRLGAQVPWLGMTVSGGVPSWLTGEAVTYTNWQETEPNDPGDTCVRLTDNQTWADRPCSEAAAAICERDE
jgi:hypothetical protein